MEQLDESLGNWRKSNTRATRAQTILMAAIKRGLPDEELILLRAEVGSSKRTATLGWKSFRLNRQSSRPRHRWT